jgi:hypothetical protein
MTSAVTDVPWQELDHAFGRAESVSAGRIALTSTASTYKRANLYKAILS